MTDANAPPQGTLKLLGFTVSRREFTRFLFGMVTVMIGLCFFHYIYEATVGEDLMSYISGAFDAGRENSIPTGFSILNLLLSSGFLFIIARHTKLSGEPVARHWFALSIVMLSLSIDEGASLHERLQRSQEFTGVLIPIIESHPWVLYGAIFATAVFLYFIPFLRQIGPRLAGLFLLSGGVFIAGALGFEFMGAWMIHNEISAPGELPYLIRRGFEEGCEMYGIALFNCVLFGEIQRRGISINIGIKA